MFDDNNDNRIPSYGFDDDNGGPYEPITLPFNEPVSGPSAQSYDSPSSSPMFGQTYNNEPPPDYQALAEAHIYERISQNGSARTLDVDVTMADRDNGHGKAMITIGKDCKKRRFEVPILIKDGKLHVNKAIDLDTDEKLSIPEMFDAPVREELHRRLDRTYDRYLDFFRGKVDDEKVKTLLKRYPSLTEPEAVDYLESKRIESKHGSKLFSALDGVGKYRNQILFGAGVAGAIIIYLLTKDGGGSNGGPRFSD